MILLFVHIHMLQSRSPVVLASPLVAAGGAASPAGRPWEGLRQSTTCSTSGGTGGTTTGGRRRTGARGGHSKTCWYKTNLILKYMLQSHYLTNCFLVLQPYFIKSEDNRNPYLASNSKYHGRGGYLTVQEAPWYQKNKS